MHDGNRKGENRPQKDQNSDEGGQSRGAEGKEEMGKKASSPTHTDNDDDDGDNEEDPNLVTAARQVIGVAELSDGTRTLISGRTCKCGSRQHQRTTHSACPLNKRRKK